MIQAGTISTGSSPTVGAVGAVGAYWINSKSGLRKTTLPGVAATSTPTLKALFAPPWAEASSRSRFWTPASRFAPLLARVASSTWGLSQGRLEGETRSSHCRTLKATSRRFCGSTPAGCRVRLSHHSSPSSADCASRA